MNAEMPSDSAPSPRRRLPVARVASVVAGVGVLVSGALALWVRTTTAHRASRTFAANRLGRGLAEGGPFIGARACRECHPGEYALYTRSGHVRTLRPASDCAEARELAGRTVDDPERPGVTWTYSLRDGELHVERREAAQTQSHRIDYAFGSAHHAMTFVSVLDADPEHPKVVEQRLTRYTADGSLGLTPGQHAGGVHAGTGSGYEMTPREAAKCFRCHSTRISTEGSSTLDLAELIPNVSCERCHGPAREHVDAARRGASDLEMPFGLGQWTTTQVMALCGQCHRDPSRAPPGLIRPDNLQLARFQPVGLAQSRCFKESPGALSCINCHDPHGRARSDPAYYEAVCLTCHGDPPRQTACPKSPRDGCITCHMPRVDSGQNVLFADHWIRVRDEVGPGPAATYRKPRPAGP